MDWLCCSHRPCLFGRAGGDCSSLYATSVCETMEDRGGHSFSAPTRSSISCTTTSPLKKEDSRFRPRPGRGLFPSFGHSDPTMALRCGSGSAACRGASAGIDLRRARPVGSRIGARRCLRRPARRRARAQGIATGSARAGERGVRRACGRVGRTHIDAVGSGRADRDVERSAVGFATRLVGERPTDRKRQDDSFAAGPGSSRRCHAASRRVARPSSANQRAARQLVAGEGHRCVHAAERRTHSIVRFVASKLGAAVAVAVTVGVATAAGHVGGAWQFPELGDLLRIAPLRPPFGHSPQ